MDSLFDASAYDAAPAEPVPVVASAGVVGQLDIFGNVVADVVPLEPGEDLGASPDGDADGADGADASVTSSVATPVESGVPVDPEDRIAEAVSDLLDATDDRSDGDDLDDEGDEPVDLPPGWDAPPLIEVAVDDDAAVDDEVPVDDEVAVGAGVAHDEVAVGAGAADDEVAVGAGAADDEATPVAGPVGFETSHGSALVAEGELIGDDGRRAESVASLWDGVWRQESAVALLRAAARRPVHAYLFLGPPGTGKRELAASFAAALLCPRGGCDGCSTCARARSEVHPDLVVVEREGASISVDQAREIIRLALRTPTEGPRKVLVLEDFHLVTNAGPTLLKIIEEPPPSTVFVVLADLIPNELVTIASRCVTVPFQPLDSDALVAVLVSEGITPERARRAAQAGSGRLDRARLLATDDELGARMEFWASVPRRLDGTGAAAAELAAQALGMVDTAGVASLEARHAAEIAALDARLAQQSTTRGSVGAKKELAERHKRELKRLRDDEVRFGLVTLQQRFAERAADPSTPAGDVRRALAAVDRIATANEHLVRNPNLALLLQALFIDVAS
jgi:DNA polymerase III subunit delta'